MICEGGKKGGTALGAGTRFVQASFMVLLGMLGGEDGLTVLCSRSDLQLRERGLPAHVRRHRPGAQVRLPRQVPAALRRGDVHRWVRAIAWPWGRGSGAGWLVPLPGDLLLA